MNVLQQIKAKANVRSFRSYLHRALSNIIHYQAVKTRTKMFANDKLQVFYNILNETDGNLHSTYEQSLESVTLYDWIEDSKRHQDDFSYSKLKSTPFCVRYGES